MPAYKQYFHKYLLMISIYVGLFILMVYNPRIGLKELLYMYGFLAIILVNIRILFSNLGNLIVLIVLSYVTSLLLVYVKIVDFNIMLGITYTILFISILLLNNTSTEFNGKLRNIFNMQGIDAELLFMWIILLLAYMFSFLSKISIISDYIYYTIYAIAGPLIESLAIGSDYYSVDIRRVNSNYSKLLFIDALYVTIIFYPNLIYMIISIIGNLSKIILGFKKGLVFDYAARVLIVTRSILGV